MCLHIDKARNAKFKAYAKPDTVRYFWKEYRFKTISDKDKEELTLNGKKYEDFLTPHGFILVTPYRKVQINLNLNYVTETSNTYPHLLNEKRRLAKNRLWINGGALHLHEAKIVTSFLIGHTVFIRVKVFHEDIISFGIANDLAVKRYYFTRGTKKQLISFAETINQTMNKKRIR